jgi:hypothetical protein
MMTEKASIFLQKVHSKDIYYSTDKIAPEDYRCLHNLTTLVPRQEEIYAPACTHGEQKNKQTKNTN